MPTLAQVRTRVDDWLTARWPLVLERQQDYFAAHGRYWQGLRSNVNDLEYSDSVDAEAIADNLLSHPADEAESYNDIFPELAGVTIPAVIRFDVYSGPAGDGFVTTVAAAWNRVVYSRSHNYGPETRREQAWHKVEVMP